MDVENQEEQRQGKWSGFKSPMHHNISIGCDNKWFRLDINPVVTFVSAAIIWGLVIWCIVEPDHVSNYYAKDIQFFFFFVSDLLP